MGLHTSGKGVQDNASDAFDAWEYILSENKKRQQNHQKPIAPLIAFYYAKTNLRIWIDAPVNINCDTDNLYPAQRIVC
ncbi:hypothetical protein LNN83_03670 [Klebsiella pneumoniae subsp. pneumoniae]|nr:hypothetical protein [Klebsiella pneumoniae subsp. pneumoniae]